jgi:ferredoxin
MRDSGNSHRGLRFFGDFNPQLVLLEVEAAVGSWIGRADPVAGREPMRVVVNTDLCEANEVCVGWCSQAFRLGEDDRVTVLLDPIPESLQPAVEKAVRSCPRQALSLRDSEEKT